MSQNFNILLLLKLPPPITGTTAMNQLVVNNPLLKKKYNINTIKISYSKEYSKIGKQKPFKLIIFCKIWLKTLSRLLILKPQIVYFQISPLGIAFYRDLFFVILTKSFKAKLILHLHGKGINEVIKNSRIKKIIYKIAFNNTFVICLSKNIMNDIVGIYNRIPFIVNNGIPITIKNEDDNGIKKNNDVVVILYISNIRKQKGIYDFIKLCNNLKNQYVPFTARIIGQERDMTKTELVQLIKDKHLNKHVFYLGPKFGKEKTDEYSKADILVHPAYNEAWGLVLLEAMEASLPIVSTYEGSIPYIVQNNYTGYLCKKGDVNCLTEKVLSLINNPEKRARMGKNGRKRFMEKFTAEHFNQNIYNVFNSVIQSK